MADPFSLLAAGVGIADVALRVISYLKDVKAAAETIEDDIEGLIDEVEALMAIHDQLEQNYLKNVTHGVLEEKQKILWIQTGQTLKNGQKLIRKLDVSVREIYGENRMVTGKRDGLLKQHRKRSKNGIISGLRDQINTYQGALNMWLTCISMCASSVPALATSRFHTDVHIGIQLANIMRTRGHSLISWVRSSKSWRPNWCKRKTHRRQMRP